MIKEEVLIVGKTRMGNTGRVCVGGLTKGGASVRLMNQNCSSSYSTQSPYEIGDIWELSYEPCGERRPPHVEDVAVTASKKIGQSKDIVADIGSRSQSVWNGPISELFQGCVQFTGTGSPYINESDVPDNATGFWIPDKDLVLEHGENGAVYYTVKGSYHHIKYVGIADPISVIPAGTMIRVSLARWWTNDPNFPERCYGQLSGWYL